MSDQLPLINMAEYEIKPDPAPEPGPISDVMYLVVAWSKIGRYWQVHPGNAVRQYCESEVRGGARDRAIEAAKALAPQWEHRAIVRIPLGTPAAEAQG